jgi:hypothetical protein
MKRSPIWAGSYTFMRRLAAGDAEASTFAARSLQIGEEASYDGLNVAEIATKPELIVVGR